jgi:hypothetical protein
MIDDIRRAGNLPHILTAVIMMCSSVIRRYITVTGIQQSQENCKGQDLFHGFHLRLRINGFRVYKIVIVISNFPAKLREFFPEWEDQ